VASHDLAASRSGSCNWDFIVEENVDEVFDVFTEVVAYASELQIESEKPSSRQLGGITCDKSLIDRSMSASMV
jgi:hypothetical protein